MTGCPGVDVGPLCWPMATLRRRLTRHVESLIAAGLWSLAPGRSQRLQDRSRPLSDA